MAVESGAAAAAGTMVPVRITDSDVYDLQGEVVGIDAMVDDFRVKVLSTCPPPPFKHTFGHVCVRA